MKTLLVLKTTILFFIASALAHTGKPDSIQIEYPWKQKKFKGDYKKNSYDTSKGDCTPVPFNE